MPSLSVPFATYDAFTDIAFGGSQAAVVSDAKSIDQLTRQRIAKEIGAPATGFVDSADECSISTQFFSTITELPMCGHGTICLITRMVELGALTVPNDEIVEIKLKLPGAEATVTIEEIENNRLQVMLDIQPPTFEQQSLNHIRIVELLGINLTDLNQQYPMETAFGDFVHLVVPVKDLTTMGRITPDFDGIKAFCQEYGIETVAVFSMEVETPGNTIHVRDFCPAVGVAESAAAGTTNAALASYLVRHDLVQRNISESEEELIVIKAEQGLEIQRPSAIRCMVRMQGNNISRLQVGGIATKIIDGQISVPI